MYVGIHYLYDKIIIMIICFIFRHIILIRHGQYNLDGKTDDQRYLTELGKEQVIKCSTIFFGKKKIVKRAMYTSSLSLSLRLRFVSAGF